MMATVRKMVDSGVDWIGEMPEDWEVSSLKNNLAVSRERTTGGNFYVGMENIASGTGRFVPGDDARIVENGVDSVFKKGVILFGKLRPYLRKVWMAEREGTCSTEFLVMDSGKLETNRFLFYSLLTEEFCSVVNDNCKGVKMPRADWENIGSVPVAIPSFEQQKTIATFLDHHVSLIDRERELIAQKVGLLKEKRKALIFECVTGKRTIVEAQHLAGIDDWSNVVGSGALVAVPTPGKDDPFVKSGRLVDSGVEWIGALPAEWKVNRMKDFGGFSTGRDPKTKGEGAVPVYGSSENSFDTTTDKLSDGPAVCIGRKGTVDRPFFIQQAFWAVDTCMYSEVLGKTHSIHFVKHWLPIVPWGSFATKTALPSLTQSCVDNIHIATPSLSEQLRIASFLDYESDLVDREINLLETKYLLLADKRKALIFEGVTGKIDCTRA